jgi:hypothetical protein
MRVAYIWPSGDVHANRFLTGYHAGNPARMITTGSNAGDTFVTEASLALAAPSEVAGFDPATTSPASIERIDAEFDIIFVRGANTLADDAYAGILLRFLRQTRLPIVTMGIGVQAPSLDRMPRSPDARDLAVLLGERSRWVGVRGEVTAGFFESVGVQNVWLIGCPSILRHNSPNLRIRKPGWDELKTFGFSLTRYYSALYQRDKRLFLEIQSRLIKELDGLGRLGIICQVEREEKAFAFRNHDEMVRAGQVLRKDLWFDTEMEKIYASRSIFFGAQPAAYDMHLRMFDVVFGSRLHSNAMAIACGVPGITISFDLRVEEIYKFWHLPVFTVERARTMTARELYEQSDFDRFNSRARGLYHNFRCYLAENDVTHRMRDDIVGFES